MQTESHFSLFVLFLYVFHGPAQVKPPCSCSTGLTKGMPEDSGKNLEKSILKFNKSQKNIYVLYIHASLHNMPLVCVILN